jgi:hypothetical protein
MPGWIVPNEESVRREVEPYRDMTPARRLALAAAVPRSALAVALAAQGSSVLEYRDPLPESTIRALKRLRAAIGPKGDDRT